MQIRILDKSEKMDSEEDNLLLCSYNFHESI